MKIAVVGAGISGLTAAYLLSQAHEVHLFEAADTIGGHTHTEKVTIGVTTYPVDMGFIVFNERTYPNFIRLLRHLKVAWQDSDMSFSVQCARTGLEFCPSSMDRMFAQRDNLLKPWFYRMILDLGLFRRHMAQLHRSQDHQSTLGDFLKSKRYSSAFRDYFIIPMGSAIWSCDPQRFESFPARYFAEFFNNHGFLDIRQPQWLAVKGGSQQYIAPITSPYGQRIHCKRPIHAVRRHEDHIELKSKGGSWQRFDRIVIATHSDQALAMLADPSAAEEEILGSIEYQANDVVLHTDTRLLPKQPKVWASWNYYLPPDDSTAVTVTYNMNILQALDAPQTFCVTLNRSADIDPRRIIRKLVSHHPVYTPASLAARYRHDEINGQRNTYFCGAYWGYGFHEDGVNSALAVTREFDIGLPS